MENSVGIDRPVTLKKEKKVRGKTIWQKLWEARLLYILLVPTLGLILVFSYTPIFIGIYYSFHQFAMNHVFWAGLENYRRIFTDPAMIRAFKNMAIILPFSIVTSITIPLFVAYLIYHLKHSKLRYWFRVLFTVPMVVPTIILMLIWIYMYLPNGALNIILDGIGLHQLTLNSQGSARAWLGEFDTALWAYLFVGVPWVAPINMLIYLAGLEGINVELIDAARVDGATGWKMFWNIELPMLGGQFRLVVVTVTISVLQNYQNILVLTNGGPGYTTMVPALRMYELGVSMDMGYGSAVGVFLFVVIMLVTVFNLRVMRRVDTQIVY